MYNTEACLGVPTNARYPETSLWGFVVRPYDLVPPDTGDMHSKIQLCISRELSITSFHTLPDVS